MQRSAPVVGRGASRRQTHRRRVSRPFVSGILEQLLVATGGASTGREVHAADRNGQSAGAARDAAELRDADRRDGSWSCAGGHFVLCAAKGLCSRIGGGSGERIGGMPN